MTDIITFPRESAIPDHRTVLNRQGIPDGAAVPPRVASLVHEAMDIYSSLVDSAGMRAEITIDEFKSVYRGRGNNAARTPLEGIYPEARRLALFAVTVGEAVCAEIRRFFDDGDPAMGYALDTIASCGAEDLADKTARDWEQEIVRMDRGASDLRVLPYSPGYCGWHVSGQQKLFAVLEPERIGISLNHSCLMQPQKSVSGVLVAAEKEAHDFDIDFAFCSDCTGQECRERVHSVFS